MRARRFVVTVCGLLTLPAATVAGCAGDGPRLAGTDTEALRDDAGSTPESTVEGPTTGVTPEPSPNTSSTDVASQESTAAAVPTSGPSSGPPDGPSVRIGLLLDESNMMLASDRPAAVGIAARAAAINADGGILGKPLDLTRIDTTSRQSTIDAAARDLIDEDVDLLVLTCELDFAEPALSRSEAAGVLAISPCAPEPDWGSGDAGALAFSLVPPPGANGEVLARHVHDSGAVDVVVLLDETSPEAIEECSAFSATFTALGGSVLADRRKGPGSAATLSADDTLGPALRRADAIVLCADWRVGRTVIEALRSMDVRLPIIAGPTLDSGQWIPDDVEGGLGDFSMLVLASVYGDDPVASVNDAVDGYRVADGIPPTSGRFVTGADLVELYRIAVERAGTTEAAAVARTISSAAAIDVVSGPITFGGRHAPTSRTLRVMRHEGDGFVFESLAD